MSEKLDKKYNNMMKNAVKDVYMDTVLVSGDLFYKMVHKLYVFEDFLENCPDEWYTQTLKEIDSGVMGLNWHQEKPENIKKLLKK